MLSHQASLPGGHSVTEADKEAAKVARKLHSVLQTIGSSALAAGAKNRVHALLILAQAANGLLHMLARVSMVDGEKDIPINSTATLFAALMAYHTAPCEAEPGKVLAEFSPLIVFDALKDVEKLSGQQPDDCLDEDMCRVARECAANPMMVASINGERSVLHRNGATLN